MMRILSIVMSVLLALTLLVGACAEGVRVNVADVTVKNGTETILLNPSVAMSFSETEDGFLMDAELFSQDGSLMAVQALVNDAGVKLTTDKTDKVYSMSKEALSMEGDDMGMISDALSVYAEMLKLSADPAFAVKLSDEMKDGLLVESEDCTYDFDGEEVPAKKYVGTVDFPTLWALEKKVYTEAVPNFDAYAQMIDKIVEEAGDVLNNFTYTYEVYESEDGMMLHGEISMDVAVEEESLSMPLVLDVRNGTQMTMTMNMQIEDVTMDFSMEGDTETGVMDCTMSFEQKDSATMHVYFVCDGEGGGAFNMDMNDYSSEIAFGMTNAFESNDKGGSNVATALSMDADGESYEITFNTTVTEEAPVDRFGDKTVVEVTDDDGMQEVTNELLGEFGTVAQTLMQDSSVQDLMAMFRPVEEPADADDDEPDENVDGESEGIASENIEDLTLGVPEFNVLPEGYELRDTFCSIDEYSEYATFSFSNADYDMISVTFTSLYNGDVTEYIVQDGEVKPLDSDKTFAISHNDEYEYVMVTGNIAGHYEMNVSYYGSTLTDEELLQFAAGIEFPGK